MRTSRPDPDFQQAQSPIIHITQSEHNEPSFNGDSRQLRQLNLADIVRPGSVALWAVPPLATFAALWVIQDFAAAKITTLDRSDPGFRHVWEVHASHVAIVMVSLYSTVSYAIWSQYLRNREVRRAEVYAVAAWLLSRVCLWLPVTIFGHVLTQIYADRLPAFGGEFGISVVSSLGAIGAISAMRASYLGKSAKLVCGLLALTVPFVAMFIAVVNISDVTPWALSFIAGQGSELSYFAFAFLVGSIAIRKDRPFASTNGSLHMNDRVRRFAFVGVILTVFVSLAIAGDLLWEVAAKEFGFWGLLVNWSIVAVVVTGVFLSLKPKYGSTHARIWASVACLISITVVLLPPVILQDPREFEQGAWFEGMEAGDQYVRIVANRINFEILSPCGISLMLAMLVASLGLGLLPIARPFMVAGTMPALFFMSLAKPPLTSPPQQLDLVYWADPIMVVVVVGTIMFFLWPHRNWVERPPIMNITANA